MFLEAVKDVAQAHQMTKVARDSGVSRESLYRSLSADGNPTLDTLVSVLKVLGLKLDGVTSLTSIQERAVPSSPVQTEEVNAIAASAKGNASILKCTADGSVTYILAHNALGTGSAGVSWQTQPDPPRMVSLGRDIPTGIIPTFLLARKVSGAYLNSVGVSN